MSTTTYANEPHPDEASSRAGTTGSEIGYRSYEVYQRERVWQPAPAIRPGALRSAAYLADPFPLLATVREAEPCYRDWHGNAFWVTRYDDVTSVFTDDANYETRSKRWFYGRPQLGRDLRAALPVLTAHADAIDAAAPVVADEIVHRLAVTSGASHEADLAIGYCARFAMELLLHTLALPPADHVVFAERFVRMQRGVHWHPVARRDGLLAIDELIAYFDPLVLARRADPGADLVSAIATLDVDGGPTTGADVVTTLLEDDHETLHGGLANTWFLLLTHPAELAKVRADRLMLKFAYLEALRHSPPALSAKRFARHEVERFGRLLPEGALLMCSAGAANRDPRVFRDPDDFIVGRTDLVQREPRGQYRADGLPSGIAFGLGKPSIYPAIPNDRPRSRYAIVRDTATVASRALLDAFPDLHLASGAAPVLRALGPDEMHTCWHLPVRLRA